MMEQIIQVYGLIKKYYCNNDLLQNLTAMVRSLNGDTDFFEIDAETFIFCLYYVIRTSIDQKKEKSFHI